MKFGYIFLPSWILLVQVIIKSNAILLITPKSQVAIEGDLVKFKCSNVAEAGIESTWLHNGHKLNSSTQIYQTGSNLYINNVSREFDGEYVCKTTITKTGVGQVSLSAYLTVVWLKSVFIQLVSHRKNEIHLRCKIDGSKNFKVEWLKNGDQVFNSHDEKLENDKIFIRTSLRINQGLYMCVAVYKSIRRLSKNSFNLKQPLRDNLKLSPENQQQNYNTQKSNESSINHLYESKIFLFRKKRGEKTKNAALDITSSKQPLQIIINEGEYVQIPCKYKLPVKYKASSAIYKWRKDGKVIRQLELGQMATTTLEPKIESMIRDDTRVSINRLNGSLVINSAVSGDAGKYSCQIMIEGTSLVLLDKINLIVIEELRFSPQPTSKNLELGSIGKIHCKVQGAPSPRVKWIQNEMESLSDSVEDINGTLTFKNVSSADKGNYTCIASNSQGKINATVTVNVVVAPRFFVAPEGPIEAIEMGTAGIHCQAIGDPKPTIQWDKNLQYLSHNNTDMNRFKFLENGTLLITEVHLDDEGRYGCTIGNSAGLKREEVNFIVHLAKGSTSEESPDGFIITRAVLITMSVAFAYIVLVIGLMLWCRYRRQTRKARLTIANKENAANDGTLNKNTELEPCLSDDKNNLTKDQSKIKNGSNNLKGSGNETAKSDETVSSTHSRSSKKSNLFEQLALQRSSLSDIVQIGRGEFGEVLVGKIKTSAIKITKSEIKDDRIIIEKEKLKSRSSMDDIEEIKEENEESPMEYKHVLIKALSKTKDENVCSEFKRQLEMFRSISHKGISKLYGLCYEKEPHYMILEYTDWGDLKQFLLATAGKVNTANTKDNNIPPLNTRQILAIAYQIARGMDAMYRARYIHKDLAARNCIISSDFVVKVSYPGLSKDKYNKEYYKLRNMLLPIRWLAPECIQDNDYTIKSDIYAYGVLVWELFTQAVNIPFEELSNEEYLRQYRSGAINWSCAISTSEDLKDVMMSCWNVNPKERPSFSQLCVALTKSMQTISDN